MLKVCQLTMARWLDWSRMTEEVPWPRIVAEPPTTTPPSGPAAPGIDPSDRSAVEVRRRLRMRGDISVSLQPSGHNEEESPVVKHASHAFGRRQVGSQARLKSEQTETNSSSHRGAIHVLRCPRNWGNIMKPARVRKAIKLKLRH